ncbi:MAG: hypothetical protein VX589_01065 [Myxococcota bacterium]|nr:hypothetical protein [Myxococcota bacterium]
MKFWLTLICLTFTFTIGCGASPKGPDKRTVRDNADQADRDLTRELKRNRD